MSIEKSQAEYERFVAETKAELLAKLERGEISEDEYEEIVHSLSQQGMQ